MLLLPPSVSDPGFFIPGHLFFPNVMSASFTPSPLRSQIWHPSACAVSSSLSLQTSGFLSLSPFLPLSVTLFLCLVSHPAGQEKTQQCVSDVLKCSASQWEVTPCKKRHFKKSSGSSKFSTVIGLNSSQIKSLLNYWFSLNMWHNLEQHFNNDTKFWMLDYWSSWIHFHA